MRVWIMGALLLVCMPVWAKKTVAVPLSAKTLQGKWACVEQPATVKGRTVHLHLNLLANGTSRNTIRMDFVDPAIGASLTYRGVNRGKWRLEGNTLFEEAVMQSMKRVHKTQTLSESLKPIDAQLYASLSEGVGRPVVGEQYLSEFTGKRMVLKQTRGAKSTFVCTRGG